MSVSQIGCGIKALLALGFALSHAPTGAQAAPPVWTVGDATVRPILSDRVRFEAVDWFDPGPGGADERYNFTANVLRFGAVIEQGPVAVTVEGQEVGLFDLPDDAAGLGPGATYFANTAGRNQRELHLRRASLAWKVGAMPGLAIEGGRFIFNDGTETKAADPGLAWVKRARVSQRLLGGFDYTHVGRSFDGGMLRYDRGPLNLTVTGGLPTAGGFNISANKHIDDIHVIYGALTATEPQWLPRSDARLFYLYYSDDRAVVATDNRALAERQADGDEIAIHTIGANFAKVHRLGPGDADVLVWAAGQTGAWQSLDHAAWGLALEAGYRLVDVYATPWLRIGWFRGSGDDDPADGDHGTFFQALPTARLYAQTPFFNLMNNEDLFVQLLLAPWSGGSLRIDYHHLRVAEGNDLLYAGGGATMAKPIFGYAGFAARSHRTVGNLIDVSLEQAITANFKAAVYYGHVFGGGVVAAQFPGDDDLDYTYVELTLSL